MISIESRSYKQVIAGVAQSAISDETFTRKSAAHSVVVGHYPLAGVADTDQAVKAAKEAFATGPWRRMSGTQKSRILFNVVNEAQMVRIEKYVGGAGSEGARVVAGGDRIADDKRLFMRPTIVAGVSPTMTIAREKVFGPVLSVLTFEALDNAIAIANDTHYGLSAGVWTESYQRALKAGRDLSAGTVWVNCWMDGFLEMPFGGMRESGIGREQGREGIEEFVETKSGLLNQGRRRMWVVGAASAEPR